MRISLTRIFVAVALLSASAIAQSTGFDNVTAQASLVTEFDVNGMKVIYKRRPNSATVSSGLFFRGGAREIDCHVRFRECGSERAREFHAQRRDARERAHVAAGFVRLEIDRGHDPHLGILARGPHDGPAHAAQSPYDGDAGHDWLLEKKRFTPSKNPFSRGA